MIIELIFVIWELLYKMINFKNPFEVKNIIGMYKNIVNGKIHKINNKNVF